MKNIPHQFTLLSKYYGALETVKQLIEEEIPLKDENLGEQLLRNGVINPGREGQSIEDYLIEQSTKTPANRGYHTAARETIKFFKLVGFLIVYENKSGELTPIAIQLLSTSNDEEKKIIWRMAFMQFGVIGIDNEISHPYRILLKIVQEKPGIETSKLMLALEAKNDTVEEFNRLIELSELGFNELITALGISDHQARNAVKILPAFAVQLGDIKKIGNFTYPTNILSITEDEITTEIPEQSTNSVGVRYSQFRSVDVDSIAKDPIFNAISTVSIDLSESIRIRQNRLAQHQEIVRQLGSLCSEYGFDLYEGKFDCLSTLEEHAIVFEIKTVLDSISDQEKQTVKGVGQLKYYKYSIVQKQMNYEKIKEVLVYSQKPNAEFISFCEHENIAVVWLENGVFKINMSNQEIEFEPLALVV